ncbi:MAG: type I methionyl aminopeptidase [Phaeodactylibacter sp.]|nr:type I methionyl aminopeptidase [Phaeodactylibacter sp.]MCB9301250.1 type I methionyl aminopeptidase [Lewinellaceae bacterium]HQU58476.1 type I methionyl aminopeptidase [Saprospiraceae bacterium]
MIIYKTDEEIEFIRQSCLLVCKTLAEVGSIIRPGMTGLQIDKAAETLIRDHGAVPSFKGYRGFPATLCVSVNENVVHGIPSQSQVFQDGDIVSVDCGVFYNGFHGDSAYTFPLGDVEESVMELCRVTNTSLYRAIEVAILGNRLGDIGFAVQNYVEREHPYGVVRELVGHGIGRELHEAPEVPNYGKRGRGVMLKDGLVIAIEPMVNQGRKEVRTASDGWTVFAKDRKPSAHYEHTIAIRKDGPDVLSNHSLIEAAVRSNVNVKEVGLKTEAV